MASGGYRNGIPKGTIKFDRPLTSTPNVRPSSIKSRLPPATGLRRSSSGSLVGKDDAGGQFRTASHVDLIFQSDCFLIY